jgi:putative Mn2+ efflux pump MntP
VAQWFVVGILAVVGGFMVFDGLRALAVGDYLTPSSGRYAGQLGPWSRLVDLAGVDPRSLGMKVTFVAVGTTHLVGAVGVAFFSYSWIGLVAAVLGLWYLPFGMLGDLIVLVLIATTSLRPWG